LQENLKRNNMKHLKNFENLNLSPIKNKIDIDLDGKSKLSIEINEDEGFDNYLLWLNEDDELTGLFQSDDFIEVARELIKEYDSRK